MVQNICAILIREYRAQYNTLSFTISWQLPFPNIKQKTYYPDTQGAKRIEDNGPKTGSPCTTGEKKGTGRDSLAKSLFPLLEKASSTPFLRDLHDIQRSTHASSLFSVETITFLPLQSQVF